MSRRGARGEGVCFGYAQPPILLDKPIGQRLRFAHLSHCFDSNPHDPILHRVDQHAKGCDICVRYRRFARLWLHIKRTHVAQRVACNSAQSTAPSRECRETEQKQERCAAFLHGGGGAVAAWRRTEVTPGAVGGAVWIARVSDPVS